MCSGPAATPRSRSTRWRSGARRRSSVSTACSRLRPGIAAERKLLLARDPMGMKPLYYTELAGGGVAFASEIKAFLALEGFTAEMNPRSLRQYLEFGYVFDEHAYDLSGVSKLPPGHAMEIVAGRARATLRLLHAAHLAAAAHARPFEQAVDELHATLSEVVREHLVADVPVGLLLSGGLDSSIIAALAARDARVATISMGFAESAIDERAFARTVAQHIGSDHREVLIHHREVVEDLEDVVWYFDDLFADWGTVSTRLLYRKCREQGIKVVLVGEGSDELFGGYPIFDAAQRGRGPMLWQLFQLYRRYAGRRYGGAVPGDSRRSCEAISRKSDGSMFDAVRLFESRNQLPNNYVMKVDKASMSVSVEARAPYLDRRVAELAYSIPEQYLLAEGTDKLILRTHGRAASAPAAGDHAAAEVRRVDRRFVDGRVGGVPRLRARRHPLPRRLGGPAGAARRDDRFLRGPAHGLPLPAGDQHLQQSRLAPAAAQSVVEKVSGRVMSKAIIPGLVSTIIPVHNRAALLREAVASVLEQSYRPIEIISRR